MKQTLRSISSRPTPRFAIVLTFLLTVGFFHAFRFWDHFRYPSLFAEEASFFLPGWITGKYYYINAGYVNVFTFGLIGLFSRISLLYLPQIMSWISVVVSVFSFSYFLLPHWEKVLPLNARAAIVIFFLVFSPYVEGIAISEYSFWYFGIGSGYLVWELLYFPRVALRYRWIKAGYVAVGAMSGPAVFQVGLSLLATYFILVTGRESFKSALARIKTYLRQPIILAMVLTGLIQAAIIITHTEGQKSPHLVQWIQFPLSTFHQAHMRIIVPTFFSNALTPYFNYNKERAKLSLLLSVVVFSLYLFQSKTQKREWVWLFLGATFFTTWIMYIGRADRFEDFRFHPWSVNLNGMRYSFIPGVMLLMSLALAFSNLKFKNLKIIYAVILLPLLIFAGVKNYRSTEPAYDVQWSETARQLDEYKKGTRNKISLPTVPAPWTIEINR